MQNKNLTVRNVDIDLLKRQKEVLVEMSQTPLNETIIMNVSIDNTLQGLIHFLDECVDVGEELKDVCPICHFPLIAGPNGATICSHDGCKYWRM